MWEFLKELTDPESIIKYGGAALLLFVIFAETGLLVGFFLPGDSLVFISGVLCATKPHLLHTPILNLIIDMTIAAVLGNIVGYWFGKRVGQALFKREDAFLFKKKYVSITRDFYARHGGKTLILGRFLPIIRTFAPILAGVIPIGVRRFMVYNILGAALWIATLTLTGYYLGSSFPGIKSYLGYIVIGLIVITAIPVFRTWRNERNLQKEEGDNH
ncbi:MAG TPA: VTT domain-containing protein [Bacteroidia bacterium]|jgi:membrane-associated protein|nr:VTT domain-containing protein [Bacteroidia bacterium]